MRLYKNNEADVQEYSGCIEGFRILAKITANSANTAIAQATDQPNYNNVILDITRDNEPFFSGTLAEFIQICFFMSFDGTGRMQYLNAELGQMMVTHAFGVTEKIIADLSVNFPPQAGIWSVNVRCNSLFGANTSNESRLLIDFDKSDDVMTEKIRLFTEPIAVAGDKNKQIVGNVRDILFLTGDNQFIATNDAAFNSENLHPVQNCSINSVYAQTNYEGEELQVLEIHNKNGYLKVTPGVDATTATKVEQKVIQKSVRLSDREIMVNPEVALKLRQKSMSTSVKYSLAYVTTQLLR